MFSLKVLKVIFSKVWDSFSEHFSIIWRNSCGNFDGNSIRTRLAWSRGSRNSKNHEFIIYSSSFGTRRQRRQPSNNRKLACRHVYIHPGTHTLHGPTPSAGGAEPGLRPRRPSQGPGQVMYEFFRRMYKHLQASRWLYFGIHFQENIR